MLEPDATAELPAGSATSAAKLAIVLAYAVGFFGVLPLLLLRLGARVDAELRWPAPSSRLWWPLGTVLTSCGAWLLLSAMWTLWRRGKGLPISHLPPVAMVEAGPFGRLRHPIYVGYTLLVAGLGWLMRSWGGGLLAPLLLTLAWSGYATRIEEPLLRARFGAAYTRYAEQTPLLPVPRAIENFARRLLRLVWRSTKPTAEWLAQRTVLFRIGSTLWVGYGACLALGTSAATVLALALLSPRMPPQSVAEYVVGLSLAMPLGGRALWLGYEARALRQAPRATLRRVGFVSFGAYLAMFGFASAWWHWRAPALPLGWLMDRTMVACLTCSGFGRLGCLTYGCCYGQSWSDGVRYLHPEAKVVRERGALGHEPRVPAQLLSALLAFGSAGSMLGLLTARTGPGFATAVSALVYALLRFQLEALRDEVRFLSGRLTRGQLLCMAIAGLSLLSLALGAGPQTVGEGLRFDLASVREHWGLPLATALPVFLVCGYHRGRVGSW